MNKAYLTLGAIVIRPARLIKVEHTHKFLLKLCSPPFTNSFIQQMLSPIENTTFRTTTTTTFHVLHHIWSWSRMQLPFHLLWHHLDWLHHCWWTSWQSPTLVHHTNGCKWISIIGWKRSIYNLGLLSLLLPNWSRFDIIVFNSFILVWQYGTSKLHQMSLSSVFV